MSPRCKVLGLERGGSFCFVRENAVHYCTYCKTLFGDDIGMPVSCPECGVYWSEHPRTPEKNQSRALGGTSSTQDKASTEKDPYQEALAQEAASEDHYHSLLTEWVIGYRRWRLRDNVLYGEYQSTFAWGKGLLQTPLEDFGERGFYAFHSPSDIGIPIRRGNEWSVVGAIKAKGDIYIGEERFRAEFAQIIVLCFDDEWRYKDVLQFQKWARKQYGCKTTTVEKLRATALQFGSEVPESIRPES